MTVVDDFRRAVQAAALQDPRWGEPVHLPTRLCWATASALRSQGAGLTLSSRNGFRVPLGASNDAAARSEQLQFTIGEGPGWQAELTGRPVVATQEFMTGVWPFFVEQLVARTPFRSVLATAIPGIGAMDVYFTSPTGCLDVPLDDVHQINDQITRALVDSGQTAVLEHRISGGTGPGAQRHQVNIAIGMIAHARGLRTADALALLRAHAVANDLTLDDLAVAVVDGSTPLEALTGS